MTTNPTTDISYYIFKLFMPYSGNTDPSKPHEGKPSCGFFCDVCGHWDFHIKRCDNCQPKIEPPKVDNHVTFKTKNGIRLVDITDMKCIQWAINPDMSPK